MSLPSGGIREETELSQPLDRFQLDVPRANVQGRQGGRATSMAQNVWAKEVIKVKDELALCSHLLLFHMPQCQSPGHVCVSWYSRSVSHGL